MTKNETAEQTGQAENSNVPAVSSQPSRSPDSPLPRFVQEHPAITIAGGVFLGALAAALLPRRSRKYVARKSSAMADAVSAAGLMLYREALERAESAGEGIRDVADRVGDRVSHTDIARTISKKTRRRSRRDRISDRLSSAARHLRGR